MSSATASAVAQPNPPPASPELGSGLAGQEGQRRREARFPATRARPGPQTSSGPEGRAAARRPSPERAWAGGPAPRSRTVAAAVRGPDTRTTRESRKWDLREPGVGRAQAPGGGAGRGTDYASRESLRRRGAGHGGDDVRQRSGAG